MNALHALELCFDGWNIKPIHEDLPFRWGTEEDTELLMQGGMSEDYVRDLFSGGARPALLEDDGELITYVWFSPNGSSQAGWIWVVPRQDGIASKAHQVMPNFRGQRYFQKVRNFAYLQLQAQGHSAVATVIEVLNRSSLRAIEVECEGGVPWQFVGKIAFLRILGLVVFRVSGPSGTLKWGAGFWTRNRPYRLSFDIFQSKT